MSFPNYMLSCTLCLYSNIYFCCIIVTGNDLKLPRADKWTLLWIFLFFVFYLACFCIYTTKICICTTINTAWYFFNYFIIIILFCFILHVSASIPQNVQNKSVYKIIISRVIFINEFKMNLNEWYSKQSLSVDIHC